MARPRRIECRVCGGHIADVGELSARGRCVACGVERTTLNAIQISEGRGEFAEARLAGLARYLDRKITQLRQS